MTMPNNSNQADKATISALHTTGLRSVPQWHQTGDENTNPTHTLPPELLCTIFTFLCTESDQGAPNANAVLTVAQVCAQWRDVALSFPDLWSTIVLSFDAGLWSLERTELYLDRSQPSLIELEFESRDHIRLSASAIQAFKALCSLVTPHLHRCRSISIIEYTPRETSIIRTIMGHLSLYGCDLPDLEKLVLQAERQISPVTEYSEYCTFTSPALVELRVSGLAIDAFVPWLSLDSITSLHLSRGPEYNESRTFFQVLAACPALHTLAVYDDVVDLWPDDDGEVGAGAELMPDLRVLHFYGLVCWISEFLLWIGIERQLDELSILPLSSQDLVAIKNAKVSNRFITKLSLSPFQESDIVELKTAAYCFPAVQQLVLPGGFSNETAGSVFDDGSGSLLWPELHTISMREVSGSKEEFLCSVVALRKEWGVPLTKVRVDVASFQRMKMLNWLHSEVLVEVHDDWLAQRDSAMYADEAENRFVNPW